MSAVARAVQWSCMGLALAVAGCDGDDDGGRFVERKARSGAAFSERDLLGEAEDVDPRGEGLVRKLDAMKAELARRPKTPEILLALGDLYYQNGRYAEAVEHYERYLGQAPDDTGVRGRVATAAIFVGRPEVAIRHLEACVEQEPENVDCLFALATTLTRDGGEGAEPARRATALFGRVLALAPEHPERARVRKAMESLRARVGGGE